MTRRVGLAGLPVLSGLAAPLVAQAPAPDAPPPVATSDGSTT